jgi:hypothetical protein
MRDPQALLAAIGGEAALIAKHAPIAKTKFPAMRFSHVEFNFETDHWATHYVDDRDGSGGVIFEFNRDAEGRGGYFCAYKPTPVQKMFNRLNKTDRMH